MQQRQVENIIESNSENKYIDQQNPEIIQLYGAKYHTSKIQEVWNCYNNGLGHRWYNTSGVLCNYLLIIRELRSWWSRSDDRRPASTKYYYSPRKLNLENNPCENNLC